MVVSSYGTGFTAKVAWGTEKNMFWGRLKMIADAGSEYGRKERGIIPFC
jgi:hypothetical protein